MFYTNVQPHGNFIALRGISERGETFKTKVSYEPTLYVQSQKPQNPQWKTLDGRTVAAVQWGSMKTSRQAIRDYGNDVFGVLAEGASAININDLWIGSLEYVSQDAGYWVLKSEPGTLELSDAEPTSYDDGGAVDYSIHYWANLISYPFQTGNDIEVALSDVSDDVFALIGEGMAALNNNGGFIGSLEYFEGGKGYWLIALEDFSFQFPEPNADMARQAVQPAMRAVPAKYSFIQSTQQAFYFVESASINGQSLENDDIIIANSEKQFVDAMNKVDMKDKSFIFNSLLPNRFRKENVVSIVEGWLNQIK